MVMAVPDSGIGTTGAAKWCLRQKKSLSIARTSAWQDDCKLTVTEQRMAVIGPDSLQQQVRIWPPGISVLPALNVGSEMVNYKRSTSSGRSVACMHCAHDPCGCLAARCGPGGACVALAAQWIPGITTTCLSYCC